MNLLWFLLPDAALPLVIVGIAFALMFRVISGRTAISLIGGLALCLIAAPFIESFVASLPLWVILPVLFVLLMSLLRAAAGLLFGRAVGDYVMGELIADALRLAFKAAFWLLALPFRIIGRMTRNA